MASEIYDFVFYNILKYDTSSSTLSGELQNDVIFGLLIPTVFIAILLYFFVFKIFGAGNKVIGTLSSITALGVIVTLGWVPLIAGMGGFAFVIILALALIRGIYSKLVPKGVDTKLYGAGKWAGKKMAAKVDVHDPTLSKKELRYLATELTDCDDRYDNAKEMFDAIQRKYKNVTQINNINTGDTSGNVDNLDSETKSAFSEALAFHNLMSVEFKNAEEVIERIPSSKRAKFIADHVNNSDLKTKLETIMAVE